VHAIECCDEGDRCCLPICAVCARDYRIGIANQLLAIDAANPGPRQTATIFLDAIERDCLQSVSIERALGNLRKRLERNGFRGAKLVGGTEVAWLEREAKWILHVHLWALGVESTAWDRLRASLPNDLASATLVVKGLNNPPRQISYLTKFMTYHRPGDRTGEKLPRAYPLPSERLIELAKWWAKFRFEDFMFLYGACRRGGRIVLAV
jgi:hypothetical protein